MSNSRQEDPDVLVRTYGLTFYQARIVPPASPTWDQLVYAKQGVLTVKTGFGTWVVPPYRALWLPANTPSQLEAAGRVALRMIYLRQEERPPRPLYDPARCAVLNVSPLMRELILRVVHFGALQSENASHRRLAGMIQDELRLVATMPLQLPDPQTEAARRFVTLFDRPTDPPFDLTAAVLESGAGRRTLERLFRSETGMGLGEWARRRKLLRGLQLLAAGETVANAAFALGYNGPSAFIAMFKRELGETPGDYLRAPDST